MHLLSKHVIAAAASIEVPHIPRPVADSFSCGFAGLRLGGWPMFKGMIDRPYRTC